MSVVVEVDLAQEVVTLYQHEDVDGKAIRVQAGIEGNLEVVCGPLSHEAALALSDAIEIAHRVLR